MSVRRETIGDVVCFLRLELTFTLIKTVLSLFDFFRRGEEFDLSKHPQVMCGETTST